ncbi:DNA polymerase III subunit delta [Candidatus Peregrinibacteria bacterium]|nr:DNA polymerase III subunit delta [Candidatus Peregrinibacteria bacterium]
MAPHHVFLFSGENIFAIREERRKWVTCFIEKHNMENFRSLEGGHLISRELLDEVSVAPFIAAARLVIIEGIPRWTTEEMENLLFHIHPQVIVLFISPKIDRRSGAARVLLKHAQCQTFSILKGPRLHVWIDDVVRSGGVSILRDAKVRLLDYIGTDQDMLYQEIQKLILGRKEITVSDIDRVVVPSREWVIWQLTDIVVRGDTASALAYAQKLIAGGQDPFALWNMLLKMLRELTVVTAAVKEGCKHAQDIADAHGIHPLAVRSLLPLACHIRLRDMRLLIDRIVEMDHALKTGSLRATADDSTELHALIDQCVLAISSVHRG